MLDSWHRVAVKLKIELPYIFLFDALFVVHSITIAMVHKSILNAKHAQNKCAICAICN